MEPFRTRSVYGGRVLLDSIGSFDGTRTFYMHVTIYKRDPENGRVRTDSQVYGYEATERNVRIDFSRRRVYQLGK